MKICNFTLKLCILKFLILLMDWSSLTLLRFGPEVGRRRSLLAKSSTTNSSKLSPILCIRKKKNDLPKPSAPQLDLPDHMNYAQKLHTFK